MSTQSNKNEELKGEDLKNVEGGSILGGSGTDLTNIVEGMANTSSSSSGSDGQGNSYTSNDNRGADLGLGSSHNLTQF